MARVINSESDINNFMAMLEQAFKEGKAHVIKGITRDGVKVPVIAVRDMSNPDVPALLPLAMMLYDTDLVRFKIDKRRPALSVVRGGKIEHKG